METQVGFLLKVLVISAGLSAAIKYLAPTVDIAPTTTNALIAVLLPTLIVAIALLWRGVQQHQQD